MRRSAKYCADAHRTAVRPGHGRPREWSRRSDLPRACCRCRSSGPLAVSPRGYPPKVNGEKKGRPGGGSGEGGEVRCRPAGFAPEEAVDLLRAGGDEIEMVLLAEVGHRRLRPD